MALSGKPPSSRISRISCTAFMAETSLGAPPGAEITSRLLPESEARYLLENSTTSARCAGLRPFEPRGTMTERCEGFCDTMIGWRWLGSTSDQPATCVPLSSDLQPVSAADMAAMVKTFMAPIRAREGPRVLLNLDMGDLSRPDYSTM